MQKMKAIKTTTIYSGCVKLDAKLAKRQGSKIKRGKIDGVFDVVEPIQIKAGITFEYDGEVTPLFLQTVEVMKSEQPKKAG